MNSRMFTHSAPVGYGSLKTCSKKKNARKEEGKKEKKEEEKVGGGEWGEFTRVKH